MAEADIIGEFIEDCLERLPERSGQFMPMDELNTEFEWWCDDKNYKTHLIHRPIDICATSPPTPDKGDFVISVVGVRVWRGFDNGRVQEGKKVGGIELVAVDE